MSKRSKSSIFAKFYFAYILVLLIALVAVFFYVRGVLVDYEHSSADKYILNELSRAGAKDGSIGEYLQKNCFSVKDENFDFTTKQKDFYQKVSGSKLEIKKNLQLSSSDIACYDITADEKPFLLVSLKSEGVVNKLGILNIPTWSIKGVLLRSENSSEKSLALNENGKLDYEINVPDGITLLLDSISWKFSGDEEENSIKAFKDFGDYKYIPKAKKVVIKDSVCEFDITAKNASAEEVSVEKDKAGVYSINPEYPKNDDAASMIKDKLDPIAVANLWVDFMQNDVGGARHGLATVLSGCKIMDNSPMYDKAYAWATGSDITFVSNHRAKTFRNESATNYIKYNDNLVSCDVYFDTDIPLLNLSGAYMRTVTQHYYNRMFFMYVDDPSIATTGWYWVGSISLANE